MKNSKSGPNAVPATPPERDHPASASRETLARAVPRTVPRFLAFAASRTPPTRPNRARFATLGDAIRAPPNERDAIERCVDSLERANPTRAPATSPAQTGDWTLRYTTSVGTMASVATWETVAGAVTDVSQRVDVATLAANGIDVTVLDVRNDVTVELRSRSDLTPLPLPLPPLTLLGLSDLRGEERMRIRCVGVYGRVSGRGGRRASCGDREATT